MLKKEEMRKWITIIIIAVFSYWFATNIDLILNILTKLVTALKPFILGLITAFILNIPMTKIENILNKVIKNDKGKVRIISIVISLVIFISIIGFVLLLLIPEIIESIENLIKIAPSIINDIETWTINLLDKYPDLQIEIQKIFDKVNLDTIVPSTLNYIVNGTISLLTNLVSGIITTFTAIVFSIYILSQKEYIIEGTKKLMNAYLPSKIQTRIIEIGRLSNQTFSKFISGQCVEAIILGSIFFVVLSILRFPYALIISVLTTITALIPIFGAMIAMAVGAVLIAIESPLQAAIFIVIFQVIQQIEGNFIYPKVVGKSVGLSPMWTLFAITIGGSLFGIIGMLTFLPIASICYAILKDDVSKKIEEKLLDTKNTSKDKTSLKEETN